MKNKLSTVFLLCVLSVSIFANGDDGTTHSGGKSCPPGQTTCLVSEPTDSPATKSDRFFKDVFDYLRFIFG